MITLTPGLREREAHRRCALAPSGQSGHATHPSATAFPGNKRAGVLPAGGGFAVLGFWPDSLAVADGRSLRQRSTHSRTRPCAAHQRTQRASAWTEPTRQSNSQTVNEDQRGQWSIGQLVDWSTSTGVCGSRANVGTMCLYLRSVQLVAYPCLPWPHRGGRGGTRATRRSCPTDW